MLYPSIVNYINALEQPKASMGVDSLKKIKLCCDSNGEAIYSVHRGYVIFNITLNNKNYSLRVFLNEDAKSNYLKIEGSDYFTEALWVYNGRDMVSVDVVLKPETALENDTIIKVIPKRNNLREDRVPFCLNGKWGYKDSRGEVAIEAVYDSADLFCEARAVVERDGYYGVVNHAGELVVELIYDEISYDDSYWFYVEREGLCGVLDRNGSVAIECEWDWVAEQSCGLFLVERCGLYSFLDESGSDVMGTEYCEATSFTEDGVALVSRGGLSYHINTKGVRVSPISKSKVF